MLRHNGRRAKVRAKVRSKMGLSDRFVEKDAIGAILAVNLKERTALVWWYELPVTEDWDTTSSHSLDDLETIGRV